ncbi:hypothetical protein FQK02_05565 [Xanthomonas vasicola]|uniref:Uncharacterized protein n=1 Tax=Xanthomonas vasicola pv. vasculorum NCPPB 890 TaxID=1184265 RepID=A0A836P5Y5_XANVA|nr:hypothetical protein NX80_004125 [Xanthomonas vasicola pv. arecae]AZR31898.1 hypothetical protein KWO_016680 [Xanthomonas vasicola pv. musacearum NCPPB 4379]AZR35890.1 hypothetical protein NX08_017065 [Xanthomonas vasicola]KFA22181.1 hypothetical protein KW5_0124250 [Xanthomonas vasicola pv. vasculorum NCPPB 1326]KFA23876.1 hypothetical protein KWU_0106450 [Xanthomonas vasicola pv. musacearum NCPPB 4394]KFA33288.1 hypothetical protein KWG_0105505 [Xanthomonas vasicola pv. vasculorum NCPPB 1
MESLMKCDLFDERMQLIDGALSVLSTQRDIVRAGLRELGISGDWSSSTGAITAYGHETDQVAVWSLIVQPKASANRMQAWLDSRPG